MQRFYVTHLHGGGFAGQCYGHIDIGQDNVAYVPVQTQADHAFAFPRGQVTATASRLSHPEVRLQTPAGAQKFIVVDRDMVERVRSTLATRAHTKDPKLRAPVSCRKALQRSGHPAPRARQPHHVQGQAAATHRHGAQRSGAAGARLARTVEQN